jgi:muconate cycloisomerase
VKPLSHITCVRIYPLSIPLRQAFSHATHTRASADPLVVQVELADSTIGYGETLPRPYVSGETIDTVLQSIDQVFLKQLLLFRPTCFAEALERIDALPACDRSGQTFNAARAAVELALLDAYSKYFQKPISEAVGWLGLPQFGQPGSTRQVRYSGVISRGDKKKIVSSVRKMRWFGLRDFKLKVGYDDDVERIRDVTKVLGKSLGETVTLRIDANGAWSLEQAVEVLKAVQDINISCVEQPLSPQDDDKLLQLKQSTIVDIMVDESLITFDGAHQLIRDGAIDGFNIRISKNGGFLPALRLVHLARKSNLFYQLGCMVGETSILSAAGRRFLENVPGTRFAEGSYGRFLMAGDVVTRPIGFGYGGKIKPISGMGWGIEVQPKLLEKYTVDGVIELPL